MKVSIIMPVYNTGEILKKTINSILNQTFNDYELLLIDDGSTDLSGEICDSFATTDSRVRVFHKENGGICSARNYGILQAQGEYIAFCDHDDIYHPELLQKVYRTLVQTKADVVKYRYQEIFNNAIKGIEKISDNIEIITSFKDNIFKLNAIGYFVTVWSFVYRREWLIKTGVLFDTKQKHGGEDFDFNVKLIPYIKCMAVMPDILYFHYIWDNLSTSSKMYEDIAVHFLDTQELLNNIAVLINANLKTQRKYYLKYYSQCIVNFISGCIKLSKSNSFITNHLLMFAGYNLCRNKIKSFVYLYDKPKLFFVYILFRMKLFAIIIYLTKSLNYIHFFKIFNNR